MENKLAEALALKGVLTAGTEVEARYRAVALGGVNDVVVTGHFSIVRIGRRKNGEVVFTLAALRDGVVHQVEAQDVLNIDGMDPARFASVYEIKENGEAAPVKARRGRKPKDRSIQVQPSPLPANDEDFDDREVA